VYVMRRGMWSYVSKNVEHAREKSFLVLIWLLVFCAGNRASGQSQPQPEEGAQQFATLGDFKLQSGTVVYDFRIG
jgi:hypothetical protein